METFEYGLTLDITVMPRTHVYTLLDSATCTRPSSRDIDQHSCTPKKTHTVLSGLATGEQCFVLYVVPPLLLTHALQRSVGSSL